MEKYVPYQALTLVVTFADPKNPCLRIIVVGLGEA